MNAWQLFWQEKVCAWEVKSPNMKVKEWNPVRADQHNMLLSKPSRQYQISVIVSPYITFFSIPQTDFMHAYTLTLCFSRAIG